MGRPRAEKASYHLLKTPQQATVRSCLWNLPTPHTIMKLQLWGSSVSTAVGGIRKCDSGRGLQLSPRGKVWGSHGWQSLFIASRGRARPGKSSGPCSELLCTSFLVVALRIVMYLTFHFLFKCNIWLLQVECGNLTTIYSLSLLLYVIYMSYILHLHTLRVLYTLTVLYFDFQ